MPFPFAPMSLCYGIRRNGRATAPYFTCARPFVTPPTGAYMFGLREIKVVEQDGAAASATHEEYLLATVPAPCGVAPRLAEWTVPRNRHYVLRIEISGITPRPRSATQRCRVERLDRLNGYPMPCSAILDRPAYVEICPGDRSVPPRPGGTPRATGPAASASWPWRSGCGAASGAVLNDLGSGMEYLCSHVAAEVATRLHVDAATNRYLTRT